MTPDRLPWKETDYRNRRSRAFSKAAQATSLGNLNPYDLRHTCVSLLAAAGWNHLEIATQLGHSPENLGQGVSAPHPGRTG